MSTLVIGKLDHRVGISDSSGILCLLTSTDGGFVGVDDFDIERKQSQVVASLLIPDLVQNLGDGVELVGKGSELSSSSSQKGRSIEDEVLCFVVGFVMGEEGVGLGLGISLGLDGLLNLGDLLSFAHYKVDVRSGWMEEWFGSCTLRA